MTKTCAYCGDTIFVGDEYLHNTALDLDWHLDCRPTDKALTTFEKRYREE